MDRRVDGVYVATGGYIVVVFLQFGVIDDAAEFVIFLPAGESGGDAVQFVVKNIAQAFGENEGEDVVLVFGRVLDAADGAGGFPNPVFEGFRVFRFSLHYMQPVLIKTTGAGVLFVRGFGKGLRGGLNALCEAVIANAGFYLNMRRPDDPDFMPIRRMEWAASRNDFP